jgi:glycosyltransferase involved in cell wall biosynthesis
MQISVVIPCYKVKNHILSVIDNIGSEVSRIYVVDDKCPEQTGKYVEEFCKDPRVRVVCNLENKGVGGATMAGYRQAMEDKSDIIVKIDGDGQMNPRLIPRFVQPIIEGCADYTKGNRFYSLESLETMPKIRIFGNAGLSFLSKLTSGYWNIMDPTNGYTAIHSSVLCMLPLHKIDNRYFFESDMLFRLNTFRAVVREIPMDAIYGEEKSNLNILKVIKDFPAKHLVRFFKRLYYNYFMRDFNVCSVEIIFGTLLMLGGAIFGLTHWYLSIHRGIPATTGTVMLAALPVIMGFQLFLSAIHYDVMNIPKKPLHKFFLLYHKPLPKDEEH